MTGAPRPRARARLERIHPGRRHTCRRNRSQMRLGFDGNAQCSFEDEDDDEDENDLGASPQGLRKDRTRFSVTIWYEDPDLLRCHQAPIGAELPSGSEGS